MEGDNSEVNNGNCIIRKSTIIGLCAKKMLTTVIIAQSWGVFIMIWFINLANSTALPNPIVLLSKDSG